MSRAILRNEEGDTVTLNNGNVAVINGAVAAGISEPQNYKAADGHSGNHPGRNLDPTKLGNGKEYK